MNEQDAKTWDLISRFPLDDASAAFRFSDRLARENGWSRPYALRVIDEYKKFIFLCCVCPEGITPSDAVDQAWHLHLTFTKSYWVDFCRNTLGKELHHNPTLGGRSEARKFHRFYSSSHARYREFFGAEPPADIWPNHHRRFSDIDFQRVNRARFWLLPKPGRRIRRASVPVVLCLCLLLFVQAVDFISFVFLIGLVVLIVGRFSNNKRKGDGDSGSNSGSGCWSQDSADKHGGHSGHGGHGGHGGHDGHSGDSGCGSGCSGCSSSGCSGCGSGCGGGD